MVIEACLEITKTKKIIPRFFLTRIRLAFICLFIENDWTTHDSVQKILKTERVKLEQEQFRIGIFPIALIATVIVINSYFLNKPARHTFTFTTPTPNFAQPQPTQPTPEQIAAAARANFLARYVKSGFERKAGFQAVAVVATSNGKLSRSISDALMHKLKTDGVNFQPSFFTTAFIADGLFDKAFDGGSVTSLPIADSLNALLLARESVRYEKNNSALANTVSAHSQLEIAFIPISGNFQGQTWSFTANGVGFKEAEALSNAEERLQKQIDKSDMVITK